MPQPPSIQIIKKVNRYRKLVDRAIKELKPYSADPTEDRKGRLSSLRREMEAGQNEYKKIGWNMVRMLKFSRRQAFRGRRCCSVSCSQRADEMRSIAKSGSSTLLVKRGRFGAEAPTNPLENQRDTSRGQAEITKSAGELEIRARSHLLESATKQRLLLWSLPNRMRKTVFFFVLFQRCAMQAWTLFLVSIERGTSRRVYHRPPSLSDMSQFRSAPCRCLACPGCGALRCRRTGAPSGRTAMPRFDEESSFYRSAAPNIASPLCSQVLQANILCLACSVLARRRLTPEVATSTKLFAANDLRFSRILQGSGCRP